MKYTLAAPRPTLVAVRWECKDYADGWIPFDKESEALEYQRDSGCLLRVIYKEVKP